MATIVESKQKKTTLDQYFEQEISADFKNEFVNGGIVAMAGVSVKHVRLTVNLMVQYAIELDRKNKNCDLYSSDQLLFVEECASIYYPDMMMVCGKPAFYQHKKTGRTAILNPTVIVEIISNSTQYLDRITKWDCYKTIPSLKEYILINQYEFGIEKYERKGKKEWLMTEFNQKEDKISITEIEISVSDIYKNTENLPVE
ncbi:MAG: Uma2 family endonuclease [Bacteroidetes bacterium]|nr:MAG: Uma2 family endonuclease [Bacteroidota bacterium]